ncbi:fluoride efflux transporter CrcB [Saccharopolyspora sp. WRP15-2]|uniref:Fluoride-specific ion channel FluC n=1 Tax=Saccharopolyspora oryzae TaxID=2997343 RepID=A0ABT4USJ5_9PSEU|nr:fluoride efflux transporter CrcB [Saccharopolyspora oryzae]MDA3624675.1 fluoride efflux transporter CrcB [Saccharopolyspora oryzae]
MTSDAELTEPIDPDVDLRVRAQRRELVRSQLPVLGVISLGGGIGALARFGIAQWLPTGPGQFPWATFWTNAIGCFLIGILMVLITEVVSAHRLVRPFIGVGFLGGFTTFSTYAVEIHNLLKPGSVGTAFAYLVGALLAAGLAVVLGVWFTRWATGVRRSAGGDAA